MTPQIIQNLVFWSGIGHFALCLGSTAIPRMLNWKKELAVVNPLIRQMFWTYAVYILVINFSFGIVSVFGTGELLNHSFLAKSLTLFIGLYWLGRILIQFFYFDRSAAPKGTIYTLGEIMLVSLFATFALVYLVAFFINNSWI